MSGSLNAGGTAMQELVLTEEEAKAKILNEKGFAKLFNEGKVKIVPKAEAGADANGSPAAEPPVVQPQQVDEEIQVGIKKSQLKTFSNINERLKAADELENYTLFQKNRIRELEAELASGVQTKADVARLQQEKEEAENKARTAEAQRTAVMTDGTIPDIQVPDFDLNVANDDELFDPDNMKKLVGHVKAMTEINKKLAKTNSELAAEVKGVKSKAIEAEKVVNESAAQAKARAEQERQQSEGERIINDIGSLQGKYEELKTKQSIGEIDQKYLQFQEDLFRLTKAATTQQRSDALEKFFNDSSDAGDAIRSIAQANGIQAPDEVDKYFTLREIANKARNTVETIHGKPQPLTLEKAYALYQVETGGIERIVENSRVKSAQRAQAAINNRQQFAEVAGSDAEAAAVQLDATSFVKSVEKILVENKYKDIKRDPEKKRMVDEYNRLTGSPQINWDKF